MSDIQSVKRAFTILKVIAAYPDGVNLARIAKQVDLPKSTVSRMLSTLESIQAVERLPYGEGFCIGPETLALVMQPSYLISITQSFLSELAQVIGEAVNLCLPDGDQVYYAAQMQIQRSIQVRDWTGTRMGFLHRISPGKLFLAHWSQEQIDEYLKRPLEGFTQNSITNPDQLQQHLLEIKQQGYAWAFEEFEKDLNGISAPIQNSDGQVIAAVNVSGPAFRFPPAGDEDKIKQLIIKTGHKISEHIKNKIK